MCIRDRAHTAYRQKELDKSINLLIANPPSTFLLSISSKILTVQVYFDLLMVDDSYQTYLFNFFDSFEKWIYRQDLINKHKKESYLRFTQKTRVLAKAILDVNFQPEKIQNFLKNVQNVQAATWLKRSAERVLEYKRRQKR